MRSRAVCFLVLFQILIPRLVEALDFQTPIIGHWSRSTSNGAEGLVVVGNYAYIADAQRGVQVIDVSDPSKPRWVTEVATSDRAMNVVWANNYLYVADRHGGLSIIDVANPAAARRVGVLSLTNCYDLDFSEGHVYLMRRRAGLAIINVHDSSNPRLIAEVQTPGEARDVAVSNTRAYVATDGGLMTINITDPHEPYPVSTNFTATYTLGLYGSHLYIGTAPFRVRDVSDPNNPKPVPSPPGATDRFYTSGGYYAPVYGEFGIGFVNVQNPSNTFQVGFFSGELPAMYVSGEYAYVIDRFPYFAPTDSGLYILPLSQRANPQRQGGVLSPVLGDGVAVSGEYAYVASYHDGLEIYTVTNPAAPVRVAVMGPARAEAVACHGSRLYVSRERRIDIMDNSTPSSPIQLGTYTNGGWVHHMAVTSNFLYVANGFTILDATDPARVKKVFEYATATEDFAIFEDYLCLPNNRQGSYGFAIFDISNRASPQIMAVFSNAAWVTKVALTDQFVYFLDEDYYLKVVDISNPRQLTLTGAVAIGDWWLEGITIHNGYAYVSGHHRGLMVFDVRNPTNPRSVGGNSSFSCQEVLVTNDLVYAVGNGFFILDLFRPLSLRAYNSGNPGNERRLFIEGPPRQSVILQQSSNLTAWIDWQGLTLTNAPIAINLTNDTASPRFYRAVWP